MNTNIERAQRIDQIVREKVRSVGQRTLANETQTSETKISRMLNEDLRVLSHAFAYMGLKVVPVEMRCYAPESIEAIFRLAKERMAEMKSAEDLLFEDME